MYGICDTRYFTLLTARNYYRPRPVDQKKTFLMTENGYNSTWPPVASKRRHINCYSSSCMRRRYCVHNIMTVSSVCGFWCQLPGFRVESSKKNNTSWVVFGRYLFFVGRFYLETVFSFSPPPPLPSIVSFFFLANIIR